MGVRWTKGARDDLLAIIRYLAREKPTAAKLLAARIKARVSSLRRHPRSGRMVPELMDPDIRELIEPPYRILYIAREALQLGVIVQ